jgi:four helix bundle suffix protein
MSIFGKSGGYRKLNSFTFATIIQLGTLRFCEKFLNRTNDPCGRQFDQMTQAARSGRANIIEGSERAATSKETEMKLTDVARASLGELRGDYEIWLLKQGKAPWQRTSPEAQAVFDIKLDSVVLADDLQYESAVHLLEQEKKFAHWLTSEDSATVANAMLILIMRTLSMLNHQLEAQGEAFKEEGGFREKLTRIRVEARAKQEDAPSCPVCEKPMKKRNSSRGKFWGCTGYPECKGTRPGEDEGT